MSEQPKFTPGPWEVRRATHPTDGEFDYAIGATIDGKRVCIAEVFGRVAIDIRPPAEATARLIAAAPDLYEALTEFLKTGWEPNTLTGGPKRMAAEAKAQAALRKVIGEQP